MELFKRKKLEMQDDQITEGRERAERIRRVLSEHALLRNPPSREKVAIAYRGAEVPSSAGIASKVRKTIN